MIRAYDIHSPVAQEGPVAPHVLLPLEIDLGDQHSFFVVRGLGDDLPERIGDERSAPELQAFAGASLPRMSPLSKPDAVHGDIDAVGDGVRALDRAPGVVLGRAVLAFSSGCQPIAVG